MATRRYLCSDCKKPYKTEAILNKHKREVHVNGNSNRVSTSIIRDDSLYSANTKEQILRVSKSLEWFRFASDGVLEIFCDNHILSTFRTCEAKFVEEIVNNIVPRGGNWSLSFGIAFHKWMEWFDEAEDKNFIGQWHNKEYLPDDDSLNAITITNWLARCKNYWRENNLDQYKDQAGFKELDGWNGTQLLLMQYWNKYGNGQERLRTVGSELGFGKNREVPILIDPRKYPWAPFRCYLTGRIDRVVDNGRSIGPMDRKTHRFFKGKESSKYKPHDAFLGYVYALDTILGAKFKEQGKACNSVIIDLIALKEPTDKTKNKVRFMRSAREFYPEDFDNFVRRQISTFSQIYEVAILGREAQWNTASCHNQYYKDCPYKIIHEAVPKARENLVTSFYALRDIRWSPYKAEKDQQQEEALVE